MEAYQSVSMFPDTECLLKILRRISVTKAALEPSFSSLKRIKMYLRSSANQST